MHNEDHDGDPLVRMIAEIDQAIAHAGLIARTCRGYYDAFREEGFTESQSLYLALGQFHGNGKTP